MVEGGRCGLEEGTDGRLWNKGHEVSEDLRNVKRVEARSKLEGESARQSELAPPRAKLGAQTSENDINRQPATMDSPICRPRGLRLVLVVIAAMCVAGRLLRRGRPPASVRWIHVHSLRLAREMG